MRRVAPDARMIPTCEDKGETLLLFSVFIIIIAFIEYICNIY